MSFSPVKLWPTCHLWSNDLFVVKCFSSTFSLFSLNERRWEQLSLCANKKQMLLQILKDNQGISHPLSHQPVRETLRAKWRSWPCSWRADAANAELTQFYGSNISLCAPQSKETYQSLRELMLLIGLLHFVIVRLCLSNLFTKCFLHEASVHDVSDRRVWYEHPGDLTGQIHSTTSPHLDDRVRLKKKLSFLPMAPAPKVSSLNWSISSSSSINPSSSSSSIQSSSRDWNKGGREGWKDLQMWKTRWPNSCDWDGRIICDYKIMSQHF